MKIDTKLPHCHVGPVSQWCDKDHTCKPWHPDPMATVQLATDAQLDAIAADYARTMEARGFVIGTQERVAIRRAAAIQDVWRVAFARVLK